MALTINLQKFTSFRSLMYRSGFVYNWMCKRFFDQKSKFLTIGKLIGKNKTILDAPCGTGYLCQYLDPSTEYYGIDLNHRFLKKLKNDQKRGKINLQKLNLSQKDIFNFEKYPNVDIIVFCDIMHHIHPRHFELIENAKRYAKKIIVCEPISVQVRKIKARDKFFNMIIYLGHKLPSGFLKIADFFFLDNDGLNSYTNRSKWNYDSASLKELYMNFGIKENKIFYSINECIGVWEKN